MSGAKLQERLVDEPGLDLDVPELHVVTLYVLFTQLCSLSMHAEYSCSSSGDEHTIKKKVSQTS